MAQTKADRQAAAKAAATRKRNQQRAKSSTRGKKATSTRQAKAAGASVGQAKRAAGTAVSGLTSVAKSAGKAERPRPASPWRAGPGRREVASAEAAVSAFAAPGTNPGMGLPLLLIIIGIVLAILVNYVLGILVILVGLALLLIPRLSAGTRRV